MAPRIHSAAHRRGVTDAAILHAVRHAYVVADIGDDEDDQVLSIGPDQAGNLLEIIERSSLIIHAMPLRKKYEPLLRGVGDHHD